MTLSPATVRDLVADAWRTAASRPLRTLAAGVGTTVGVAGLICALSVAAASRTAVSAEFEAGRSRFVTAVLPAAEADTLAQVVDPAARERLAQLPKVESVGVYWSNEVPTDDLGPVTVFEGDPNLLETVQAGLVGRSLSTIDVDRALPACLVGNGLRVGNGAPKIGTALEVGRYRCTIVGILTRTASVNELLVSVLVPEGAAPHLSRPRQAVVVLRTDVGASQEVAAWVPAALDPWQPTTVRVNAVLDPREVHDRVSGEVRSLALAASALVLLVGAIAGSALAALGVAQRAGEIGLRRAIGASRGEIATLFAIESLAVGLLSSILGAVLGTTATAVIAGINRWPLRIDLLVVAVSASVGILTGLVSGLIPARSAARIHPAEALRS